MAEADEAVRLAPKLADAHLERANALGVLGRTDEQAAALDKMERLGGLPSAIGLVRTSVLIKQGRLQEADDLFAKLIERYPTDVALGYGHSLLLLHRGDFVRGLKEYELRLDAAEAVRTDLDLVAPRWQGEALTGRKLLVYGEQGFGDAIQFARYLPLVADKGGETTLLLRKPMQRLFRTIADGMAMVDGIGAATFDAQVSIVSLAHVFGTTEATIPPAPYLAPEPALVEKWRSRLGAGGFRVGIVWQGNVDHEHDRFRSLPLARLAPLAAIPGVRLISLQAVNGLDQLDRLPTGMTVERLDPEMTDPVEGFSEIAGVMANLDLVLVVDTAMAHLAGAVGVPVWMLASTMMEWRWIAGRTDSPWYRSMRIFRQTKLGDWDDVIAEITDRLRAAALAR